MRYVRHGRARTKHAVKAEAMALTLQPSHGSAGQ